MLFNSLTFAAFLLVVFAIYWLLPWHRARLAFLLLASWAFYAAWYPRYLLLFLAVTAFNYFASWAVQTALLRRPSSVRGLVAMAVVVDLSILGYFKYSGFLLGATASTLQILFAIDWHPPLVELFLPLGISFYIFQMIAYVVDLARGDCGWIRNPLKMSLFIAFFPQLIAGPIVRASEFIGQLESSRRFSVQRFLHGIDLVALGVFKKVVVADQLSPFVDGVFIGPSGQSPITVLVGIYAYSVQIYCDFSGYTDIGRGCAYCLGYELPRNFRAPYFAGNVIEFWRRWHITLSNWLRDYLYIPLGGNRQGRLRTYMNLIVTMGLGGLWHGASWTFVVWGLLHGLALAGTRFVHEWRRVRPAAPLFEGRLWRWASVALTFHFVSFAWIFFRSPDFETAFAVVGSLARLPLGLAIPTVGRTTLALVILALVALAGLHSVSTWARVRGVQSSFGWAALRPFAYFFVAVSVSLLAGRGAQQFIYFQF